MANITRNLTRELTDVRALPDEVAIDINKVEGWDGYFTPDEAREFAAQIIAAADESATIDWREKANGDMEIVPRG